MNLPHQARWAVYIMASGSAMVSTTLQLMPYLPLGLVDGNIQFWRDTMANPASRFITIDILFVFAVVWFWMVGEARRLKMRHYGWYFPAAALISFSATLPFFMLHRDVIMARQGQGHHSDSTGFLDRLSVVMAAGSAIVYAFLAWRTFHQ